MKEAKLSMIVATAKNWAIGRDNQLLWHISEDLKYFKEVTTGATILMGRNTWYSIGRPLPNRKNVVVSRSLSKKVEEGASPLPDEVLLYNSLESAIKESYVEGKELFIIGGGEIYRATLPYTKRLYLTIVNQVIEDADTFFPEINFEEWEVVKKEEVHYGTKMELIRK